MCRRTRTDVQDAAQELYCSKGGQLDGSMCRLSTTSTNPPKTRSTCDAGYTPDGSTCYKPTGSTPTTQYGCDSGWTPVNGQCTYKAPDKPATVKYVCADGSTPPAGGPCAAGVQSTAYVYLAGKAIAEVNSVSGTQYVHTDALGSPVAHTGASGSLLNTTRFEPYGAVAQGTKPGPATSLMGYTGHVQDPETDLVYMQQRYYDPMAGRFLSVDPVVTNRNTGRGFGRYHYAANNPYAYVDPDGREEKPKDEPKKLPPVTVTTKRSTASTMDLTLPAGSGVTVGRAAVAANPVGTFLTMLLFPSPLGNGTLKAEEAKSDGDQEVEEAPDTHPENFEPVKGTKGKKDKETGEIWEKDQLHKDHYEVYKSKRDYERGKRDRDVWADGRAKRKF